ncbi:uncharacterized protein LOC129726566 isoform X2 [Wyeomyia smithii]|uniref:uncharacterized protein LOC129726566 isoform X2 n=1 Tax=Wyeomyia smithii TaxID=174621 RepID=UPI0024681607|nr:uncharacterized protein LOC129726566 isoform X2 [Wyeomyia smithii]
MVRKIKNLTVPQKGTSVKSIKPTLIIEIETVLAKPQCTKKKAAATNAEDLSELLQDQLSRSEYIEMEFLDATDSQNTENSIAIEKIEEDSDLELQVETQEEIELQEQHSSNEEEAAENKEISDQEVDTIEEFDDPTTEMLRKVNNRLKKKVRILNKKVAALAEAKLDTENHALRLSKECMALKDSSNIPKADFTEMDGISMTKSEIKELSKRASTDSIFAGLLAMKLIGASELMKKSVTGEVCRRFAKKRHADGTSAYPPAEQMNPEVVQFICRKEEIDDLDTFLSLRQSDYIRLNLTTKMIKLIEKLQVEYRCTEESIDENLLESPSETALAVNVENHATDVNNNPYGELNFEQCI